MTHQEILNEIDCPDKCLLASLYCSAMLMQGEFSFTEVQVIAKVIDECKLDTYLMPRKSAKYTWANSGSQNESENTWLKRPTYRLYKLFGINLPKGLNGDQLRAFAIFLYLTRQTSESRRIAKKLLWGFVLRLGFYPSLMEHILFKPQALVLVFKMFPLLRPFYLFSYLIWYYGANSETLIPNTVSTTNKISLLPTMLLLGFEMPPKNYIKNVYSIYFELERPFIGEAMTKALLRFL